MYKLEITRFSNFFNSSNNL